MDEPNRPLLSATREPYGKTVVAEHVHDFIEELHDDVLGLEAMKMLVIGGALERHSSLPHILLAKLNEIERDLGADDHSLECERVIIEIHEIMIDQRLDVRSGHTETDLTHSGLAMLGDLH